MRNYNYYISIFIVIICLGRITICNCKRPKLTLADTFKPYGPNMCRQLCDDSDGTFLFINNDLSCLWFSKSDLNNHTEYKARTSSCNENTKIQHPRMLDATVAVLDICCTEYTGENMSMLQVEMTSTALHSGDLHSVQAGRVNALHQACAKGMLGMVKCILSKHRTDINCRGSLEQTPIMVAAENGHIYVFDYLISHGCDLSAVDRTRYTVLHWVCYDGNIEIVRKLVVYQKCDTDRKDRYGRTPVMVTVRQAHENVFDFMLKQGCNLLAVNGQKENLLHLSCAGGNVNIVRKLFSYGQFGIEDQDMFQRTPVMKAVLEGKKSVFDFLVRKGCDLSAVDKDNDNVLYLACYGGNAEIVRKLVATQIFDIERKGKHDRTPVMMAVLKGHEYVFDFLVKEDCNLLVINNEKYNLVHLACIGGNVNIVGTLLNSEMFDIEARGKHDWTLVMVAAFHGKTQVVKYLVSRGCNLSFVDDRNDNVLHAACMSGHTDVVRYLVIEKKLNIEAEGFTKYTPVMNAVYYGDIDVYDFLVSRGCNLTKVSQGKNNILHIACIGGHVKMVRHLIKQNIFDLESRGSVGKTPVMIATDWRNIGVVELLVKECCNLTAQDDNDDTILHLPDKVGMMRYLLSVKALKGMVKVKNKRGQTPIQVTTRPEIVSLLKSVKSE